jgi:pimeloyl-ACP methyl ester carboxylesterase
MAGGFYAVSPPGKDKVNIVAHSMGGRDAHHMMFKYRNINEIHKHVASLTTVSAPHSGSPFADLGLKHPPELLPIARTLGLDLRGLADLMVTACESFNERPEVQLFETNCVENDGIQFRTYAGSRQFMGGCAQGAFLHH